MDSKTIVERYGAKLKGQLLLWEDYDYILRRTPFKSIDPDFDKEAQIHWWMHVYIPKESWESPPEEVTPYEIYKSWSDGERRTFKYTSTFGYDPVTIQAAVNFRTYKKEPVTDMAAELALWLPHVKPSDNCHVDGGGKRTGIHIHIQEHTCSEHGVYSLQIFGENEFEVGKVTYGQYRVLQKFTNLESVVYFISQNHWLEKKRR